MIKGLKYQYEELSPNSQQTAGWYEPSDNIEHFEGFIGKIKFSEPPKNKGTDKEGEINKFFKQKGVSFCNAVRCILAALNKDKGINKPALMRTHKLQAREYNLALSTATAMIESSKTLLEDRREQVEGNIKSLEERIREHTETKNDILKRRLNLAEKLRDYKTGKIEMKEIAAIQLEKSIFKAVNSFRAKKDSIANFKRKLKKAQRKLASLPSQPHVFAFGKNVFNNQPVQPAGFVEHLPIPTPSISLATLSPHSHLSRFLQETPEGKEGKEGKETRREAHNKAQEDYKIKRAKWRAEWDRSRNSMFGARGSSDEVGGNSTYRITFKNIDIKERNHLGTRTLYKNYLFNVHHQGKLLGCFALSEKDGEKLQKILLVNNTPFKHQKATVKVVGEDGKESEKIVNRKVIDGRTALKVFFHNHSNGNGNGKNDNIWHIHIGHSLECAVKTERFMSVLGAIGIDTNNGHFDSCEVGFDGKTFQLGEYHKNEYDINAPKGKKRETISGLIRNLVERADALGYAIVMENLDWEGGQKNSGCKLAATLSAMPYRTILYKVMRECARKGVPFRLVNAKYTSILGNLLATQNCRLSRDVAAAGIIAMLGLSPRALDTHLKEIVDSSTRLRINVKNKFGRDITVVELNLDQLQGVTLPVKDTKGSFGTEPNKSPLNPNPKQLVGVEKVGSYRVSLGRAVKNIASSIRRNCSSGMILCYPRSVTCKGKKKGDRKYTVCKSPDDKGKPNPVKSTTPLEKSLIRSLHPCFSQGDQL